MNSLKNNKLQIGAGFKNLLPQLRVILFCIACSFLFLLLFSQTLSPLYRYEGCDSSVYKIMGLAIIKGKVLYADIFDEKGPVLYLIEAFGQWLIPGRIGLFLLANLFLSVAIFCWYKTARIFTTHAKSLVAISLTLLTYYFYAQRGNLTEDWNITFISIAYCLLLSFLLNEQKKNIVLNGLFIGACLACSFFIRPNDAVSFIGAPILGVCVWEIKEKRIREVLGWIGGLLMGAALVVAPIVIWFAVDNALADLWYGIIGFNTKFVSGLGGMLKGGGKILKFNYLPFIAALLILAWKSEYPRTLYIFIPTAIAAYFLLGNRVYLHYWIAWIPILFFSFWIFAINQENWVTTVFAVCVFLSIPVFKERKWLDTPVRMFYEVRRDIQYNDSLYEKTAPFFEKMKENERDSIWSYNLTWGGDVYNRFNVFVVNRIVPCNRVILFPMEEVDTLLQRDMDITAARPKYILFSYHDAVPSSYSTRDSLYIQEKYHRIQSIDNPNIVLYQRNDEGQDVE